MEYKIPTPVLISKNLYDPKSDCWKQQYLRVKEVQKITKGNGATLCFLDDGIGKNTEIENLDIERWTYFKKAQPNGSHSTFGATVIAGTKLGIFPEMKLVSKQVLDPESGTGGTKEIISAIYKAAEMGLQTINLSLGSNYPDPAIEKALKHYCSNGINIATIASGNDGPGKNTTDYPASYAKRIKGVLSVAATQIDRNGVVSVAMFSSRGIVTIAAPGHALKAMDDHNKLDFISGTSFAAPIVGATIAVARTLISRPLYQDEILALLKSTSQKNDVPENIGSGHVSIINFFNEVIELPNEPKTISPLNNKGGFCQILNNFFNP